MGECRQFQCCSRQLRPQRAGCLALPECGGVAVGELDLGEFGEAALEILVRWLVVAHGAVVERFVGLHVEVAGAGEAEEDRLFASFRLAAQRFIDGGADGVARFRRGQDAFGAGELLGGGVTSAP